jgi:hypothetical protein
MKRKNISDVITVNDGKGNLGDKVLIEGTF